jgi:hypothetical protein
VPKLLNALEESHFRKKGWVQVTKVIEPKDYRAMRLYAYEAEEKSKKDASDTLYIDNVSMLHRPFWFFYSDKTMWALASDTLNVFEPHFLNDRLTARYSKEEGDRDKERELRENVYDVASVKIIVFLYDVTDENGGISIKNSDNGRLCKPRPRKGDVIILDSNTIHSFGGNYSKETRHDYECFYSSFGVGKNNLYETRFNNERKESKINAKSWHIEKRRQEKLSGDESPE